MSADLKKKASQYVNLTRLVARANKKIKKLKKEIVDAVKPLKSEQQPIPSGGWSWTITAKDDGTILRVTKSARPTKSSFDADSDDLETIRELIDDTDDFGVLFEKSVSYSPVDDFKAVARKVLNAEDARELITLCTNAAKFSVTSETKESDGMEDES